MLYPHSPYHFPHSTIPTYQHARPYGIHSFLSFNEAVPSNGFAYYQRAGNVPTEPPASKWAYADEPNIDDTAIRNHPSPSSSENLTVETISPATTSTTQSSLPSSSSSYDESSPAARWFHRVDYPVTASGKARLSARYLDLSRVPFEPDCDTCYNPVCICKEHQLDIVYAEIKGDSWKEKRSSLPAFDPSQAVLGRPSGTLAIASIKAAVARLKKVDSMQEIDIIVTDLAMWRDDTRCRRQHLVQFRTQALASFKAFWSPTSRFLPYQDYEVMVENMLSLDSLSFFASESLEMTRRAHIFAILFGRLLQRNIVEPTDVVRACEWLLQYAENDGFVQGLCALLLSSGDKLLKGDQKKLENTSCLRNALKYTRKRLENYGETFPEQQILMQEISSLIEEYVEIQAQKRLAKLHGQKYQAPN